MKRIVFALSLFPTIAFAQNAAPTPEDYQTAIQTLQAQRDAANNQIVDLSIRYAQLQRENARLQGESKDKKND